MRISRFARASDNHPKPADVEWRQLVEMLSVSRACACTVTTCVGKKCPHKDGELWSPASYPPGATRADKNVIGLCAISLDGDHLSEQQLAEFFRKLNGYRFIFHTTHSDRANDRAARFVIALSHAVSAADWPRFWRAVVDVFGAPVDEGTKDASRMMYMPSRPCDVPGQFHANDGAPLDVDAVLASAPASVEPRSELPAADERIPDGARNTALTSFAGSMRSRGMGKDEIEAALLVVNRRRCDPPLDDGEVRGIARSVMRYEPDADPVPGAMILDALAPVLLPPRADSATIQLIPTRFFSTQNPQLDVLLNGGYATAQMTGVVAPPGAGKSGYAGGAAQALEPQVPVLHASTELPRSELKIRHGAYALGWPWIEGLKGNIPQAR